MRDRRRLLDMRNRGLLDAEQDAVVNWVMNYPASASTRQLLLCTYIRWLRYAGEKVNPTTLQALTDLNRLKPRKLAKIPSTEVAYAVLSAMRRSQARNFYWLIAETGLRYGEARSLCWRAVDLEKKQLIMEQSEKRSEGSILPLSDTAIEVLEDQRRRVPSGPGDLVFRIDDRTLYRALARAKRRMAHLPGAELVNAKNLRHLFATKLYAATKDLVYVQRMLRHRSILTTQRYVHMVTSRRTYDVKAVPLNDSESIKMLLGEGYDPVAQNKSVMFLRRLRE